jgi:hypothetical protein
MGWDRSAVRAGANNPPFAMRLQRMGHTAEGEEGGGDFEWGKSGAEVAGAVGGELAVR